MYSIEQSSKFKKDLKRYAHDKEKLIALSLGTVQVVKKPGNYPWLFCKSLIIKAK